MTASGLVMLSAGVPGAHSIWTVSVDLVSPEQRCSEWGGGASTALETQPRSQAAAAWSATLDTVSGHTVSTRDLRLEVKMADWGHHV